jgi:methylmalonyl-CoA mutase
LTGQTPGAAQLRYVTAAALFDGHDASINIIRRLLVQAGAEVIHLGHNRSVPEVVSAVLQEDADGVAISSYQGGHVEFFKFLHDELAGRDLGHVAIFGGGGGVIIPTEIQELQGYGISRIYSPDDGRELGLLGIVADMNRRTAEARARRRQPPARRAGSAAAAEDKAFAYALSCLERHLPVPAALQPAGNAGRVPVVGITGTGGAGKSSLTDELLRR